MPRAASRAIAETGLRPTGNAGSSRAGFFCGVGPIWPSRFRAFHARSQGLEEYEEDTGEELDFDVIALCCDFSEMTAQEVIDNYGLNIEDDGNQLNNAIDWINDQTWYVGKTDKDTIIFRQF